MLGKKTMVAVRSTLKLEVPLCFGGKVLADAAYIRALVDIANLKLAENQVRIDRLQETCVRVLDSSKSPEPTTATADRHSVISPAMTELCQFCQACFSSRNKLHKHLSEVHAPGRSRTPSSDQQVGGEG